MPQSRNKKAHKQATEVLTKNTRMRGIKKVKSISVERWRGPEVSRRLRLPEFMKIGLGRW
jgi:hypothetical protein